MRDGRRLSESSPGRRNTLSNKKPSPPSCTSHPLLHDAPPVAGRVHRGRCTCSNPVPSDTHTHYNFSPACSARAPLLGETIWLEACNAGHSSSPAASTRSTSPCSTLSSAQARRANTYISLASRLLSLLLPLPNFSAAVPPSTGELGSFGWLGGLEESCSTVQSFPPSQHRC